MKTIANVLAALAAAALLFSCEKTLEYHEPVECSFLVSYLDGSNVVPYEGLIPIVITPLADGQPSDDITWSLRFGDYNDWDDLFDTNLQGNIKGSRRFFIYNRNDSGKDVVMKGRIRRVIGNVVHNYDTVEIVLPSRRNPVVRLEASAAELTVLVGETARVKVSAVRADGSAEDVTGMCSNPPIPMSFIDARGGCITGAAPGRQKWVWTYSEGEFTGSAEVTVTVLAEESEKATSGIHAETRPFLALHDYADIRIWRELATGGCEAVSVDDCRVMGDRYVAVTGARAYGYCIGDGAISIGYDGFKCSVPVSVFDYVYRTEAVPGNGYRCRLTWISGRQEHVDYMWRHVYGPDTEWHHGILPDGAQTGEYELMTEASFVNRDHTESQQSVRFLLH